MEKLEIYLEKGYDIILDKSCILAFWELEYTNPTIYDSEFEKIWNDLLGNEIEGGFTLDSPIYSDESGEHDTGFTSWSLFWKRVEQPNYVLLEVNEPHKNDWDDDAHYRYYAYLINKLRISEQIGEDFQADPEWIKRKFQVKIT